MLLKFISEIKQCCNTRPYNAPSLHDGPLLPQQEAGDDPDDRPGAGRRHHRLPPVRDRAERGNNIHQGESGVICVHSWRNGDSKHLTLLNQDIQSEAHIYIVAKTKLDLNYISINCHHILPTIQTPSLDPFSEYPCAYQL